MKYHYAVKLAKLANLIRDPLLAYELERNVDAIIKTAGPQGLPDFSFKLRQPRSSHGSGEDSGLITFDKGWTYYRLGPNGYPIYSKTYMMPDEIIDYVKRYALMDKQSQNIINYFQDEAAKNEGGILASKR